MIPEFKFKRKDTFQKKREIKDFLREKIADNRVKAAGAAAAAAVGVMATAFAVLAVPSKETVKKESITAMLQVQTAGVTTQINDNENHLQEQMSKVSMSREDVALTGTSMDMVAGFSADAIANESIEEEIAAEATAEAVVAAATQPAVEEEPVEEPAQPVHPQLVGFSNPGIANVDQYVNIRVKPDENSTICGKLSRNAACEILGEQNGWYQIITNGVEGYIKAEFLTTGEEAWQLADQLKYAYVRVITETLYVREAPSTDSSIIELVSINQKMNLLEEQEEWVKVQVGQDGKEGYLNKAYIAVEYTLPKGEAVETRKKESKTDSKDSKDSKSSKSGKNASSVVEYATQFVGNPYVYGGTSLTKGTDCSGFTMSVYAKFGVYLPHSSAAQSKCGTKVSSSDLQPGDLIFYGSGSSVNHVALYIGGGKIVHASTEKTGIKISNAFYRTPVTIRRVR